MTAHNTEKRITLIDAGISKKQEEIKTLEAQKQELLHPITMRTVMEKTKAAGLSTEEITEKLGLEVRPHILWRWATRMRCPFLYT